MQIPIISGIYTDGNSEFRTSYPRNMVPVPKDNGISKGYLRMADGIVQIATSDGADRGGINWNGTCYRVCGSELVSVSTANVVTTIATMPGTGQVSLDYSFDYLGIAAGGSLYLYDGSTVTQVTDADLGTVVDFIWIDGYFLTTDGTSLIVTELTDSFAVNPLKYGSSEVDPDPIKAVLKLRGEPCALNRYTIEFFENIGGSLFPFQRIEGAQITKGTIGTHTCCIYLDSIAFIGSGRDESPAIWLGSNGTTTKLSSREIDILLQQYTEVELANCLVETKVDKNHQHLYVHLPDFTVVYDAAASQEMQTPVWFVLTSSIVGNSRYLARNFTWCNDRWICGHPSQGQIGYLTSELASHWGAKVGWEFGTVVVYNEGIGAIFNQLELVCLTGRALLGADPSVWTCYSADGETWSQERSIQAGRQGQRNKRLVWLQQGPMRHWRIQKFRGTSDAMLTVARLEAQLEPLMA